MMRTIRLYELKLKICKSKVKIRALYKQEIHPSVDKIVNCKVRNRYNENLLVEPSYRFQENFSIGIVETNVKGYYRFQNENNTPV